MKTKRLILASILLLVLLTLGVVCAEENQTEIPENNTPEDVQTPIEAEKISNYTYTIENLPEGNVSDLSQPLTVKDMPPDATGNISMSINGDVKYSDELCPLHNQLFLDKLNLPFGEYLLEVKYTGDVKYQGFIRNSTFNYTPISFDVPDEVIIDDYAHDHITITYVDNIKGNVKVLIDGATYFSKALVKDEIEDNFIELVLDDLPYGFHTYQITYSNGNYKSVTKKGSFNLTYLLDIRFDRENPIFYGDIVTFEIYTRYLDEAKINVTLNGKNYTAYIMGDSGTIELSDFKLGENQISITYGDATYPLKTTTETFDVKAKLTAPSEIGYNNNESIILNVPSDITGELTVKINDDEITSKIVNGTASVSLNGLVPDTYNISISCDGLISQTNYTLTVKPNIIMPYKSWVNDKHELIFSAPESYNGILKIKNIGEFEVKNGTLTVPLDDLKGGGRYYILELSYDTYNWTIDFIIYDESPNWDLGIRSSDTYNHIHNDYGICLTLPDYPLPEGTLTLYFDGVKVAQWSINIFWGDEHEEIPLLMLDNTTLGNHTLTYEYSGDDYYKAFNITKIIEAVDVDIIFPQYSEDNEIIIIVPRDDEGTITCYVDGKHYKTIPIKIDDYYNEEDDDAYYVKSYYIELTDYQTHEIEVNYTGKYGKVSKKENFTLDYPLFTGIYGTFTFCEDKAFDVYLPEDAKKQAIVFIDGVQYFFKNDKIDISNFKPGTYTVNVTYPGDDKYPQKTLIENLTIKANIQISDESYEDQRSLGYGYHDALSLTLPSDAVGNLTLFTREDGQAYSVYATKAIKDGKVSIDLPSSKIGTYYAKATFNGNYEVDDYEIEMFIYPDISYPGEMTWGDNEYLTLKTSNVTNAWLILTRAYHEDYASVKFSGNDVKISLSKLDIDMYEYGYLEAHFFVDGEEIYTTDVNLEVKAIKARLVGGKNINAYYGDAKTYSLKIWGDYGKVVGAGEIVTVKVGSTTYKLKTDKNGVVKIKLTKAPGTYTIKATYHGVSVKHTLKVKHILTLKTVKVKKSAKKLVLQATLKKGKKAIKGKTVTFKFNGKTYKAKTNSKGIAKVTIKKSVLKKLKKGKKITYKATYQKDTAKKTAKVKK